MKPERTKEAWTALQIAVYAVNCSNTDEYIDEVARLIEEYRQSSPVESKWVSVKDKPLVTLENEIWTCTNEGEGEFLAAVPLSTGKWWIRQCVIVDGFGLALVDDLDTVDPGWEIQDVTHYWKLSNLPELPPIEETKEK